MDKVEIDSILKEVLYQIEQADTDLLNDDLRQMGVYVSKMRNHLNWMYRSSNTEWSEAVKEAIRTISPYYSGGKKVNFKFLIEIKTTVEELRIMLEEIDASQTEETR